MNYFKNCQTLEQAKNEFRDLCKKLHPDTSGYDSQSEFIAMFKAFKSFKPTKATETDNSFNADAFYDLLKNFDVLNDIQINFVGTFIWLEDLVFGATFRQKETIKAIQINGFKFASFASAKKAWYFAPSDYIKKSKKRFGLDEIKNTFGCKSFNSKNNLQLK